MLYAVGNLQQNKSTVGAEGYSEFKILIVKERTKEVKREGDGDAEQSGEPPSYAACGGRCR